MFIQISLFASFALCCLFSVWRTGVIGYYMTIGILAAAVVSFAVLDNSRTDGRLLGAYLDAGMLFLLFFYFVSAKAILHQTFLEPLTHQQVKDGLVKINKQRPPFSMVLFVPHVLLGLLLLDLCLFLNEKLSPG